MPLYEFDMLLCDPESGVEEPIKVTYIWRPGSPPPMCHDHDAPDFCSMGTPDELEILSAKHADGIDLWPSRSGGEEEQIEAEAWENAEDIGIWKSEL